MPPRGGMGRFGGAKRDRTADLLHAMQALSQLSYGPIRTDAWDASVVLKQSAAQNVEVQAANLLELPFMRSGLYTPFAAASSAMSG